MRTPQFVTFAWSIVLTLAMMTSASSAWAQEYNPVTILASSDAIDDTKVENLFDNNFHTNWACKSDEDNIIYVIFKIAEPKAITRIRLSNCIHDEDLWGQWQLYGANFTSDADATLSADTWHKITDQYDYIDNLGKVDAYQYYMIKAKDVQLFHNYSQMGDFKATFADGSLLGTPSPYEIFVVSSSGGLKDMEAPNLFDCDLNSKWISFNTEKSDFYVIFKLHEPQSIIRYILTDNGETNLYVSKFNWLWKGWKLYGIKGSVNDESVLTRDYGDWEKFEYRDCGANESQEYGADEYSPCQYYMLTIDMQEPSPIYYFYGVEIQGYVQQMNVFAILELEGMDIGSDMEGIEGVQTSTNDASIYDLQGRHISHPTQGIYIKGGKRVLVK